MSCRHHLALEVNARGRVVINRPFRDEWGYLNADALVERQCCSLDIADRDGVDLGVIGDVLGISRQRVQQIMIEAQARLVNCGAADDLRARALRPQDIPNVVASSALLREAARQRQLEAERHGNTRRRGMDVGATPDEALPDHVAEARRQSMERAEEQARKVRERNAMRRQRRVERMKRERLRAHRCSVVTLLSSRVESLVEAKEQRSREREARQEALRKQRREAARVRRAEHKARRKARREKRAQEAANRAMIAAADAAVAPVLSPVAQLVRDWEGRSWGAYDVDTPWCDLSPWQRAYRLRMRLGWCNGSAFAKRASVKARHITSYRRGMTSDLLVRVIRQVISALRVSEEGFASDTTMGHPPLSCARRTPEEPSRVGPRSNIARIEWLLGLPSLTDLERLELLRRRSGLHAEEVDARARVRKGTTARLESGCDVNLVDASSIINVILDRSRA